MVFVALLAALLLLLSRRAKQKPSSNAVNFEITDTEKVEKIFLKNRNNQRILLQKKDGRWHLNDSLIARESAVNLMLTTLRKMRIKGPVAITARDNIIRNMAAKAVKVEVYDTKGKIKSFYVGGATPDQFGTYMYLEGSLQPYVVYIPGFDGYLTPRFSTAQDEWESRKLFRIKPEEITEVSVNYQDDPRGSFTLTKKAGDYTIVSDGLKDGSELNFGALSTFFNNFENISFEGYPPMFISHPQKEDSIQALPPWCVVEVKGMNNQRERLYIWQKEARTDLSLYDQEGNPLAVDPERLYARKEGSDRLVHIQIYVFRNILVKFDDFLLKNAS